MLDIWANAIEWLIQRSFLALLYVIVPGIFSAMGAAIIVMIIAMVVGSSPQFLWGFVVFLLLYPGVARIIWRSFHSDDGY